MFMVFFDILYDIVGCLHGTLFGFDYSKVLLAVKRTKASVVMLS